MADLSKWDKYKKKQQEDAEKGGYTNYEENAKRAQKAFGGDEQEDADSERKKKEGRFGSLRKWFGQ